MFKGRHFDQSVILLCVRWYLAYGLSLRDLKEKMAESGIGVDHPSLGLSPWLLERFNRRKRAVTRKWHVDETTSSFAESGCIFIARSTAPATPSSYRDLPAAKRFFRKALERHGRPERVVIDGSQANREAIVSCDAENRLRHRSGRAPKRIRIRQSRYLNNRSEQDHRRIKRRVRTDARFQLIRKRDCNPGRSRDDPHDAQTAGEVRL